MKTSLLQQSLENVAVVRRFYFYEQIDSTMTRARKFCSEARRDDQHGTLLVADYQHAGRGRHSRSWISPPGKGLLATLILSLKELPISGNVGQVSIAASAFPVAVCRGLREYVQDAQIKYPNDIVSNGRKLGGLLLEAFQGYLLVGFGINCLHELHDFPADLRMPASSIYLETGKLHAREQVLRVILHQVSQMCEPDQYEKAIGEMNRLCETVGREVCIDTGNQVLIGKAQQIDSDGRLVLTTGAGMELIHSSQVVRTWPLDAQGCSSAGP